MRVIYNNIIPFRGFSAMMLCGVIFARKSAKPLSKPTINHEEIHAAQARECGGYILFYLRYIAQWLRYGYRNCPFEREAYDNQYNLDYLTSRRAFAWKNYV
ncbi:MAG: hypothetical protein LBD80_01700 [Tannerella sp.]|jgi:hypothetical protein|nr:hypothetical protein [Tannerella sp.]